MHEVGTLLAHTLAIAAIEDALGGGCVGDSSAGSLDAPSQPQAFAVSIQMLDYFPAKEGVSVDAIAARAFDDFIASNDDELAEVIEDYRVAIDWPEGGGMRAKL